MSVVKTDLNSTPAAKLPFQPRSDIPRSNVQAAIEYVRASLTIGGEVQAWSEALDQIAALARTDGNVIVGNGTAWVVESGGTARASLGLTIGTHVQAWAAVLDNTTASFLTAQETKLGYLTVTQAVDLDTIETRVNALDAAVVLMGGWDASAGTFPGAGTAQAGASYIVTVAGTVDGVAFSINDRVLAYLDNASTTTYAANWLKLDYTDQVLSVAGKTGAVTIEAADITDSSANSRAIVTAATYAAIRALLDLEAGTDFNAYSANLAEWSSLDPSPNGGSLVTAADYAAMKVLLGLVIGTNVQAYSANLSATGSTTIKLVGKETIFVPVKAMTARTTNGAASGTTETTTNDVMVPTLDFDQSTEEGAGFWVWFPKSWNLGTVTAQPIWTASAGTGGVVFGFNAYAFSNDDALDTAPSGQQTSTDTLIATGDVHIGPESSAITIGGTPAAGDAVYFQITREVADGSDTLSGDAKLIGVKILFTTDAATDA